MKITVVILTYNRRDRLRHQMNMLSQISYQPLEIIVVDNCSDETVYDVVSVDPRASVIRNDRNEGAVGRNRGIAAATGDIVITLDDDVWGISDSHIHALVSHFRSPDIAAVNFKILEDGTEVIANWCHPCAAELFSERVVETNHISEGAVALRRSAINEVGIYPSYFFISHEGPDLAFRLINAGYRVIYSPAVVVTHAYEKRGRASWRRYYFDTRNQLWLVLRNLSFWYGVRKLAIGWGAMFIYAARDGYLRYWAKAILDSLRGAPRAWSDRVAPSIHCRKRWRDIERHRVPFLSMVRKRLFKHEVRI